MIDFLQVKSLQAVKSCRHIYHKKISDSQCCHSLHDYNGAGDNDWVMAAGDRNCCRNSGGSYSFLLP